LRGGNYPLRECGHHRSIVIDTCGAIKLQTMLIGSMLGFNV
jgi:hypothetical protein